MNEHIMPIPSRIYNAAVGGHVCGLDDIDFGQKVVHLIKYDRAGNEVSFESQVTQANKIYVIHDDFVLSSDVTIPTNCVLEFDGGSISNRTVVFNNTILLGNLYNTINSYISGTIKNKELLASTIGITIDNNESSNTSKLQNLLSFSSTNKLKVVFDWNGLITINEPLVVNSYTTIVGKGIDSTYLKKSNNAGNVDCVFEVNGQCISISGIRLHSDYPTQICINSTNNLYRSEIKNIFINGFAYAIQLKSSWLSSYKDITIAECNIGIKVISNSTSLLFEHIFIQVQGEIGMKLDNVVYSTCLNCANDNAKKGALFDLYNSNVSFVGCGAESVVYDTTFLLDSSTISILGGNYHTIMNLPESTPSLTWKNAVFALYRSSVIISGTTFGSGNFESPVPFINDTGQGSDILSNLTMTNCKYDATWNNTEAFTNFRMYIYVSKKGYTDIFLKTILNSGEINYETSQSGVVTIPGTFRWGGKYNVILTAKDSVGAVAIASGYYISNDNYQNLQISFVTPPSNNCVFNYNITDGLPNS